jgi:hypothetical protein
MLLKQVPDAQLSCVTVLILKRSGVRDGALIQLLKKAPQVEKLNIKHCLKITPFFFKARSQRFFVANSISCS